MIVKSFTAPADEERERAFLMGPFIVEKRTFTIFCWRLEMLDTESRNSRLRQFLYFAYLKAKFTSIHLTWLKIDFKFVYNNNFTSIINIYFYEKFSTLNSNI